jgi:gamma-butyrobetaine dioxygenase
MSNFNTQDRIFWDNKTMTSSIQFIPHNDFMSSPTTLFHALQSLSTHGLIFLTSVPDSTATDSAASLSAIVNRIGPLRNSFYGITWDVRSVAQATNVAYTHQFLGLHMDLCYLDLTPQFQFLHSMRARAPGGESLFSDSFAAAARLREEDSQAWKALCEWDVTFHYYNAGESYRQTRKTVELDDAGAIRNINWSPPFQGPFAGDVTSPEYGEGLNEYIRAAKRFEDLVSSPDYLYEYRMKEGDCVIFDNRRVLHARRAFDVTKGERWLKGAYMDRDAFASRWAVVGEEVQGQ